jgi:hypothetical protein
MTNPSLENLGTSLFVTSAEGTFLTETSRRETETSDLKTQREIKPENFFS